MQRDFDDTHFFADCTLDELKAAPFSLVEKDPIEWRVRAYTHYASNGTTSLHTSGTA